MKAINRVRPDEMVARGVIHNICKDCPAKVHIVGYGMDCPAKLNPYDETGIHHESKCIRHGQFMALEEQKRQAHHYRERGNHDY